MQLVSTAIGFVFGIYLKMVWKQVCEVAEFGNHEIVFDALQSLLMVNVHAAGDCLFLLVVKVVELSFHPRRAITVQLILKVQHWLGLQRARISVGLNLMMTILFVLTFVLLVQICSYHSFAHIKTHRYGCLILRSLPTKGIFRLRS